MNTAAEGASELNRTGQKMKDKNSISLMNRLQQWNILGISVITKGALCCRR